MKLYYYIAIFLILGNLTAFAQARFSADRIVEHARQLVAEQFAQGVEIEYVGNVSDQIFADSDVSAEFTLPTPSSGSQYNVIAVFTENQSGRKLRKLTIPFRITEWIEAAIAIKRIDAGTAISAADVRIEKRQKQTVQQTALEPRDVIGKKVRRSVAAGTVLDQSDVVDTKAILRGAEVTIIAVAGNIAVRTSGRAMSDAAEGEEISVQRRGSNASLRGIVKDQSTVIVTGQ